MESFGSKMNLSFMGGLGGFAISPTLRHMMEQQAWGAGGVGGDGKMDYDWGQGSCGFVSEYTGAAAREAYYMQVLGEYARGGTATNSIGGGGGNQPETAEDGSVIIYGKRPGFFKRTWRKITNGLRSGMRWLDKVLAPGDAKDDFKKIYDYKRGGIVFTSSEMPGGNEAVVGGDNIDRQSENVDGAMFLFNYGGSGGIGQFSRWFEGLNGFLTAGDYIHQVVDKYSNHAEESKIRAAMSISEKTAEIRILEMPKGNFSIEFDPRTGDTTGFGLRIQQIFDSLNNIK